MAVALGRTASEEARPGLHKLTPVRLVHFFMLRPLDLSFSRLRTPLLSNLLRTPQYLKNQLGLLFTNREKAEVCQWFADYSELEYARSGNIAPETVTIEAGRPAAKAELLRTSAHPLSLAFIPPANVLVSGPLAFPHTMEPKLRELGLPVKLVKGVVTLMKDHTICQQGAVLDPKQTKLLVRKKFL